MLLKRWTRNPKVNAIFNEEWATMDLDGQQIKTVQQNILYYEEQELLRRASKYNRSCVVDKDGARKCTLGEPLYKKKLRGPNE